MPPEASARGGLSLSVSHDRYLCRSSNSSRSSSYALPVRGHCQHLEGALPALVIGLLAVTTVGGWRPVHRCSSSSGCVSCRLTLVLWVCQGAGAAGRCPPHSSPELLQRAGAWPASSVAAMTQHQALQSEHVVLRGRLNAVPGGAGCRPSDLPGRGLTAGWGAHFILSALVWGWWGDAGFS